MTKRSIILFIALIIGAFALPSSASGPRACSRACLDVGKTVGEKCRAAFLTTGAAFSKAGIAVWKEGEKLFIRQGRFWKRVGRSFADFEEER